VVYQINPFSHRPVILANGQDLNYIRVVLQDNVGVVCPKAENKFKFDIPGPGTIIVVGNTNPVSIESIPENERKAWRGRCLVIIKSEKMKVKSVFALLLTVENNQQLKLNQKTDTCT
jgi:beta-galactosidase